MERLWPRLLALGALLLMFPAGAYAGVTAKRDRGGVGKGLHLTAAERKALDIASVKVYAQEGLGILVDVRFRGDFAGRIGKRHLRRASVAMTLEPRSKRARNTVLVVSGRQGRPRLRAHARSKRFGAARRRRTAVFFVYGSGASSVKSVAVRSRVRDPRVPRGAAGAGDLISADVDPQALSDAELQDLYTKAYNARERLGDEIANLVDEIDAATGEQRPVLEGLLKSAQRQYDSARAFVSALAAELKRRHPQQPSLGAVFDWDPLGSDEVAEEDGRFTSTGEAGSPIAAIKVVIPRQITDKLCPTQLPTAQVSGDTLVCSGGSLPVGDPFRVHLKTSPAPEAGMGGQLFGEQDGTFRGPFPISGP